MPRSLKDIPLKDQTRDSLEFAEVLRFFAQKAQTHLGKAAVLNLDLMPLDDQEHHYGVLECWCEWLMVNRTFRFPPIPEPESFFRKPRLDPFGAKDLRDIRDLLLFWASLYQEGDASTLLPDVPGHISLEPLASRLANLFERNGSWRDDISPTYARLIRQYRSAENRIDSTFQQLLQQHRDILSEAVAFTRNNRKVLAVKKDFKGKVRGILQDYSGSGNTVFVEPDAIVQIQNQLHQLDFEIREELFKIRCELTEAILEHPYIWEVVCPHLVSMDLMQALALTAKEHQCLPLQPNKDGVLDLRAARHPFLDQHFAIQRQVERELEEPDSNKMVPFYLTLDTTTRGLIISGANAGGKTVTLKTTGLLAWMANSGVPIPVDEGSRVPFYKHICADIGDHQSLSHNLSTYASHLRTMNLLLHTQATPKLVLLDELGSGTDPLEGNALAQAIIETLVEEPNHLLVTTHQQILCTLALNHDHLDNGSMVFDQHLLRPTYKFQQGVPGRSHALDIAANTGLPQRVLARAKGLLDDSQLDVQAAIQQLQETNRELEKQKARFRKEERRLVRRIADARKEALALEQEREKFSENARLKVKKTVEAADRELRQILRNASNRKQAQKSLAEFQAASKALLPETPKKLEETDIQAHSLPLEKWQVGDRVFLANWRMEGQLVSHDRKRALVNCQGKQLQAEISQILHLDRQELDRPIISDHLEGGEEEVVRFELNLLGFRVEDAVCEIDRELDLALRKHAPFLKIIHGHGTGALKAGVRDFLKTHPARQSFQMLIDPKNDGITEIKFNG